MLLETTGLLRLTDSIVSAILQNASGEIGSSPTASILSSATGRVSLRAASPISGANGFETAAFPGLDDKNTGEEIYEFWTQLSNLAVQKAKNCSVLYNEAAAKVISLENQKNACYARGDELKKSWEAAEARKRGLDGRITSLRTEIANMEETVSSLESKVRSLEKDKEIYDILLCIPILNIVSEIIAAIDGTRKKLSSKKGELSNRQNDLRNLNGERDQCLSELRMLEDKIRSNKEEAARLEYDEMVFQKQRDTAAQEMIDWKNREQYYLNISGEMEHLIAMEANVEEFKKLIADNPPAFSLTA